MERNEHLDQELLVLSLEGQRKAVDDRAQDLQQLAHPVEVLCLIDEPQEDVVDLLADERPKTQELAVDPVQHRLQKVPLPRVLTVKEL